MIQEEIHIYIDASKHSLKKDTWCKNGPDFKKNANVKSFCIIIKRKDQNNFLCKSYFILSFLKP